VTFRLNDKWMAHFEKVTGSAVATTTSP
jgi:hypothetical protein